jgi:hypothetical protein
MAKQIIVQYPSTKSQIVFMSFYTLAEYTSFVGTLKMKKTKLKLSSMIVNVVSKIKNLKENKPSWSELSYILFYSSQVYYALYMQVFVKEPVHKFLVI